MNSTINPGPASVLGAAVTVGASHPLSSGSPAVALSQRLSHLFQLAPTSMHRCSVHPAPSRPATRTPQSDTPAGSIQKTRRRACHQSDVRQARARPARQSDVPLRPLPAAPSPSSTTSAPRFPPGARQACFHNPRRSKTPDRRQSKSAGLGARDYSSVGDFSDISPWHYRSL